MAIYLSSSELTVSERVQESSNQPSLISRKFSFSRAVRRSWFPVGLALDYNHAAIC